MDQWIYGFFDVDQKENKVI